MKQTRPHDTNQTLINRVLIISWNFPPKKGGMENLIFDIYRHLGRTCQVDVIAPFSNRIETDNHVHRAPLPGLFVFFVFSIFKGFILLFKSRPQIIMGGSLVITPVLVLFKLFCPVVAYAHGLDIIYKNKLYQLLLQNSLPHLDGIICNSSNTKSLLARMPAENNSVKTEIITPCIAFDSFKNANQRPLPQRYLLSIGRLTERKGIVEFITHSFNKLATSFSDLDFVIIGGEPEEAVFHGMGYKQKIENCLIKNDLSNRVHLLGWVDESTKKQFLSHCECFVFPVIPRNDDVEGFGIVAIEAAAAGKPTIAFNVGGIRDAILNDITGRLIQKNDYAQMTNEIQLILDGKSAFFPKDSESYMMDKFDCHFLAKRYFQFFKRISQ